MEDFSLQGELRNKENNEFLSVLNFGLIACRDAPLALKLFTKYRAHLRPLVLESTVPDGLVHLRLQKPEVLAFFLIIILNNDASLFELGEQPFSAEKLATDFISSVFGLFAPTGKARLAQIYLPDDQFCSSLEDLLDMLDQLADVAGKVDGFVRQAEKGEGGPLDLVAIDEEKLVNQMIVQHKLDQCLFQTGLSNFVRMENLRSGDVFFAQMKAGEGAPLGKFREFAKAFAATLAPFRDRMDDASNVLFSVELCESQAAVKSFALQEVDQKSSLRYTNLAKSSKFTKRMALLKLGLRVEVPRGSYSEEAIAHLTDDICSQELLKQRVGAYELKRELKAKNLKAELSIKFAPDVLATLTPEEKLSMAAFTRDVMK